MSPEKEHLLYSEFPRLYRSRHKPVTESMMLYGFAMEDGWFDLVWQLSIEIERLARAEGRTPDSDSWPEATQVKEKFGRLRYHLRNPSPAMRAAIDNASNASAKTCEICGNPSVGLRGSSPVCGIHHATTA